MSDPEASVGEEGPHGGRPVGAVGWNDACLSGGTTHREGAPHSAHLASRPTVPMRFETIARSIVTLTLVSCQNLDAQRSYLQPGERAVRISTSVWDRADLEDDLGVDLVDDFHAHELTIEHALNGRIGLYGGIGSRSYDLAAGPTER